MCGHLITVITVERFIMCQNGIEAQFVLFLYFGISFSFVIRKFKNVNHTKLNDLDIQRNY